MAKDRISYVSNRYIGVYDTGQAGNKYIYRKLTEIRKASTTPIFMDGTDSGNYVAYGIDYFTNIDNGNEPVSYRYKHGGNAVSNFVFADGHAAPQRYGKSVETNLTWSIK